MRQKSLSRKYNGSRVSRFQEAVSSCAKTYAKTPGSQRTRCSQVCKQHLIVLTLAQTQTKRGKGRAPLGQEIVVGKDAPGTK